MGSGSPQKGDISLPRELHSQPAILHKPSFLNNSGPVQRTSGSTAAKSSL